MTRKLIVAAAAVAALGLMPGVEAGSNTDRATGGGQVLIGQRGGAGDTIAFTAQETATGAKGQVQYVDREATTQTVLHGRVLCLRVSSNTAEIGGVWNNDAGSFELLVTDNGQGQAAENDLIALAAVDTPTCGNEEDDDDSETALARGNAQVYDAPE